MELLDPPTVTPNSRSYMRNNAIFWVASLGVSFLNYLFYPLMGRLLNPVAFGETQTIISVLTQTGAFFQVLGLVSIGVITKYSDEKVRDKLTNEISRLALVLSLFFFGLSIILSPLLKSFFHFGSVGPFLLLGLSLLINVPLAFANAYLQGNNRFKSYSLVNILGAVSKLVLAISLVLVGLKTLGAIGGIVGAQLLALGYSLKIGKGLRHFVAVHLHFRKPQLALLRPELPFAVMVLITSLTTNLFISFDILVVKHYFTPSQAGLYTGISIISNIIYYATVAFAAVMIPSIKPLSPSAKNYQTLRRSLLITVAVGGGVLGLFLLIPHLVVLLLLGQKYALYAGYLRGLAISMFVISIANLFIYYHIGLRHFLVAPAVFVALVATLLLLNQQHGSMGMVVRDLVIGSLLLLGLVSGLLLRYRREPAL